MPEPRDGVVAQGPQAALPVQGLRLPEVQPDCGAAAGDGGASRAEAAAGGRGRDRAGPARLRRGLFAHADPRAALGTRHRLPTRGPGPQTRPRQGKHRKQQQRSVSTILLSLSRTTFGFIFYAACCLLSSDFLSDQFLSAQVLLSPVLLIG